jgi:hypothetical protein
MRIVSGVIVVPGHVRHCTGLRIEAQLMLCVLHVLLFPVQRGRHLCEVLSYVAAPCNAPRLSSVFQSLRSSVLIVVAVEW